MQISDVAKRLMHLAYAGLSQCERSCRANGAPREANRRCDCDGDRPDTSGGSDSGDETLLL